jgi:hypothetical protein
MPKKSRIGRYRARDPRDGRRFWRPSPGSGALNVTDPAKRAKQLCEAQQAQYKITAAVR